MRSIWYLLAQFRPYKRYISLSIFFQLLTALLTLVSIPLVIPFFQILFDVSPSDYSAPDNWYDIEQTLTYGFSRLIAISDKRNALALVCFLIIGVVFLRNVTRYFSSYFLIPARNGVLHDLRKSLFKSFEDMSLSQRYQYKKGQLLSSLSYDMSEIDHGLLKATELIVKTPLIILGCIIFMLSISVKLTMISVGLSIVIFLVIALGSNFLKRKSPKLHSLYGELNVRADEYLSAKKLIESYNAQDFFKTKTYNVIDEHHSLSNRMLRRRDLASPISECLLVAVTVLILYVASYMVFDRALQPETFFAFIFAFFSIIDPAKNFSREYYNVQRSSGSLQRVKEIIDSPLSAPTVANTGGGSATFKFKDVIEFKSIDFGYDVDSKVLDSFSLTINNAEKLAIVGTTGEGKTTIIDLLLRFYNPDTGTITVDGVDILRFDLADYRDQFAMVTQDHIVFNMSLGENLSFSEQSDEVRLKEVLNQAQLNPHIFETGMELVDQGANLSGGEKQRITIARALYKDADILIFDEPTSNLDYRTAQQLIENVVNIKDKTIIVISHDLRLLSKMDRVVLMKEGNIIDSGSFWELKQQIETIHKL
jgi:subfamily B ATP-binding cassette protein MsbA